MAEIVNLNRARKAAQKREELAKAAANRAQHGQSRAAREAEAKRRAALARTLDSARRE